MSYKVGIPKADVPLAVEWHVFHNQRCICSKDVPLDQYGCADIHRAMEYFPKGARPCTECINNLLDRLRTPL